MKLGILPANTPLPGIPSLPDPGPLPGGPPKETTGPYFPGHGTCPLGLNRRWLEKTKWADSQRNNDSTIFEFVPGYALDMPPELECASAFPEDFEHGWYPSCSEGTWDYWMYNPNVNEWWVLQEVRGNVVHKRWLDGSNDDANDWRYLTPGGSKFNDRERQACSRANAIIDDWEDEGGGSIGTPPTFPVPNIPGVPPPGRGGNGGGTGSGEDDECEAKGKSSLLDLLIGSAAILFGLIGMLAPQKRKRSRGKKRRFSA